MNKKLKILIALTLAIQLFIPSYLLYHHYSILDFTLNEAPEYKFRLSNLELFSPYKADENDIRKNRIFFHIEDAYKYRENNSFVTVNAEGLAVYTSIKSDSWFDYDYYQKNSNIAPEEYEFEPDINLNELKQKVNSRYRINIFKPKDEKENNNSNDYVTAKVYKGIFIPTAVYVDGQKIATITKKN